MEGILRGMGRIAVVGHGMELFGDREWHSESVDFYPTYQIRHRPRRHLLRASRTRPTSATPGDLSDRSHKSVSNA